MIKNELSTQQLLIPQPLQILIPHSPLQHVGPRTPPSQQSKQGVLMRTLMGPRASFSVAQASISLSDYK